jgi:hypothetical protein
VEEFSDSAEQLFHSQEWNPELFDYTSFSNQSRLFVSSNPRDTWEDALLDVGCAYRTARLSIEGRHEGEKRKLVSQPFSIFDPKTRKNEKFPVWVNGKKLKRNAKCFFLNVSETVSGKYEGNILMLLHKLPGIPEYEKVNKEIANQISLDSNLKEIKNLP